MKKLIIFAMSFFMAFHLISVHAQTAAQITSQEFDSEDNRTGETVFIKEFKVKLEAQKKKDEQQATTFNVVLNRDRQYRFSIFNKSSESKAVIELYNQNQKLMTNEQSGILLPHTSFSCPKSSMYQLKVYFANGEAGEAVVILSEIR